MSTTVIAGEATARSPQGTAQQPRVERSTRILLVEDEPLTAEVFARALARDGYAVDVAGDGLQALRRLRQQLPGLLVLDMSLPALGGADVLRALRADGHLQLPVVVVSGSARRAVALDDGVLWPGTWLEKPVKPRELVRIVRELTDASP